MLALSALHRADNINLINSLLLVFTVHVFFFFYLLLIQHLPDEMTHKFWGVRNGFGFGQDEERQEPLHLLLLDKSSPDILDFVSDTGA